MTLGDPADRPDAADVVDALVAMGPQQRVDPRTTVLPSAVPPTQAISLPAGPGPLHSPEPGDGGPDTSRLTQAVDATRPVAHAAAPSDVDTAVATVAATSHLDGAAGTTSNARPDGTPVRGPGHAGGAATSGLQPAVKQDAGPSPLDGPTASESPVRTARPAALAKSSARRRRHVLPWLVSVLVLALVAAALWALTAPVRDAAPAVEPLPAVSGEPGEKLQELYESVKR
jgi:hypothetical protein